MSYHYPLNKKQLQRALALERALWAWNDFARRAAKTELAERIEITEAVRQVLANGIGTGGIQARAAAIVCERALATLEKD